MPEESAQATEQVIAVTRVARDAHDQYAGTWGPREYRILEILEEVATPPAEDTPERTLAAYVADVIEAIR